jgi:exopolyphosphatase/guanosine-5'-triphosphate,3'-diphosphate pyrophosphatase
LSTVRVAAIDCGTNTIRLLIADIDPGSGVVTDLDRRLDMVRLGEGVDRTGRFDPAALERTLAATRDYAQRIAERGVTRVRMVATSATRDAVNRDELITGVRSILGIEPEVITGDEEASLAYAGATGGLPEDVGPPFLVVDIGGGSTEFVLGDGVVTAARSVDIGSVRLTERHFADDPPAAAQVARAAADIDDALTEAAEVVDLDAARTVVAVAGTATTIGAIHAGLDTYDAAIVHHARVPAVRVSAISERLLAATHDERAAITVIHPGRVDVIAAGSLILRHVVERSGAAEVVISEHDILDGIALSLVQDRRRAGGTVS